MAQIIKHRRGSLESISGATKRAGELLVVTGSAGITADNGDSLLFIGVDGSTATAANKVLQGSSTPDLSGASYDTSVDGIPFYNTSTEKLYLLNKGGNVEIKASANTGGTGIVSGSSQITISETTGFSSFSGSLKSKDDAQDAKISSLESFSSSQESTNSDVQADLSSLFDSTSALNTFSASQEGKDATLATYTASVNDDLSALYSENDVQDGRLDALEAFSSSLDSGFVTQAELASATGALESADSAQAARLSALETETGSIASEQATQDGRLDDLESFEANIDSTIKTKLDADGVISGSSQVQIGDVTGFTAYSSSVDSRVSSLEDAVGEGSNIDGRLTALESFSGSQESKDATLATYTASVDSDLSDLFATASDHETRIGDLETFQSDIETAISVNGQDVVVNGNFTVSGTQTIVDSTTVQIGDNIIELNGSGAANGGLWVKDATAPNTATGSIVWDSTNDYWKAGVKGEEIKVLLAQGDSVVSGSSQITLAGVTGFSSYSTSVNDAQNAQDARLLALEVETGSISNEQSAQDARLSALEVETGSIASEQGVQDGRLDDLENFSSSLATNFETTGRGIASGSSQIVSYLDGENVNLGGISGSSLDITGNAKIDGNIVIGGNITIGDASSDTIAFGGEISSDIIPSATNTYDLGSSTDKFAEIHATNIYGAINGVVNATNGVVSGSSQVTISDTTGFGTFSGSLKATDDAQAARLSALETETGSIAAAQGVQDGRLSSIEGFTASIDTTIKTKLNAEAVVSSSAQVVSHLLNSATDFGTGRVSGDDFGNVDGSTTFTGSFVGDGSGLTGLATNLSIEDGKGNSDTVDLLNDTLSIASGSGLGVDVTVSNNTITISGVNASTSTKGVASFDADDFSVSSGNVSIKANGVRAVNLNSDVAGTGISLNGVDNSIEVDYGSTAGTAVEGDTNLTIQGTSNEIEISGGSITLGNGGTVTIGLPDDVTIGNNLDVTADAQVGGDLTVVGNLFVQGTTTTVDSTTIQLGDNIIELNGSGAANGGLLVKDVTNPNTASGSLLWDSTNDYWKGGALGSEKEFARIDSSLTAGTVLKADANGLLVDTTITDDGTDVSITGDFTIGGLTANSFVVADGSKTLVSVVPSNAGDLIQWNGSSFVASNTVDGGTF